ncbi:MAG: two-component system response regulator [Gammaproteobacteria bacterium]|nr:response regulator [Gammaproteobacteria bacterium]PCH64075.1 MAG: two-component system response regulator [Gammaproteobacteria bacterium]
MDKPLLIVDDDTLFAETLSRALTRKGYVVSVANDLDDAFLNIAEHRYDYAVIDLKLGNQSGLEVVSRLHRHHAQCSIVVLTGFASIATAVGAIKLGASQYLMKPVEIGDLCDVLEGSEREQSNTPVDDDPMSVKRLEWEHIQRVLTEHDGNVSAAARSLTMHRRTLQRKLQKRPVKR